MGSKNSEIYQKRLKDNVCAQCAKGTPREGKTTCQECANKAKIRGKKLRDRRKSKGLCILCGRPTEENRSN